VYSPVNFVDSASCTPSKPSVVAQTIARSELECALLCASTVGEGASGCPAFSFTPDGECRILREADACRSDSGQKIFVRTGETGVGEKLAPFGYEQRVNDRLFWVFQQRMDGRVNFSRNWSEYENGFGNRVEFWSGLKSLRSLAPSSRRDVTLRIEMTTLDGERFVGEWYGFTIGEVFVGYAMNYKDYLRDRSNISDDALFDSVGMPFSTYDRDSDRNIGSCSKKFGSSGFWFSNCAMFSPNGLYSSVEMRSPAYASCKFVTPKRPYSTLREIRMMVQL
uniref:Fibrinogen C-terminal domain-containing protein n=1 Tax=Macrostomum lignano TaxID=282301 RepID=A0A1I8HLT4_9PLAT